MKPIRHLLAIAALLALWAISLPALAGLCSAAFSDPSGINENLTGSGNELNLEGVQFQNGNWPTSGVSQSGGDRFVSQAVPSNYQLVLGAGETMVIYVSGNLNIPRGTRLNENGSPGQLLIIVEGSLTIEGGGNNPSGRIVINGFIYSGGDVNGTIDVGNNVFIDGALAAGGAITEGNRAVNFSPSDLNSELFDGLCDVGVSIAVNGDAFGPVAVNVGDPVTLSVSAAGCEEPDFLTTRYWREVWTVDGQEIAVSDLNTTSTCDQSPVELPESFDTEGSKSVSVEVQYVDCLFNLICDDPQSYGSDTIQVNVASTLTCFSDDYTSTSLNPDDWVTSVARGTFTPGVVNGRLRMTEASANQSTSATLQREIPGADNLVILEFDYYAYGGSGADGIAVVFSDANVTPQPGSFGGSLGYAQRNNGDDGFAGGWLGIGIDEFGNFSAPTEGRQGGPGRTQDSVSIRGSGSGDSGYRYLAGTGQLNPGIDSTGSSTPHRYRIIVDSRTSGQALASVERDTGSGFQELIAPFDVSSEPGQAAVPENFLLSLTGSTGGSTNIHELDAMELCALQLNPVGDQVDHFEIVHDGIALTCQPETVSLRACANSDCSELFTDPVDATLAPASGWQGGNVVSLVNGTGQATLSNTTAEVITLDVIGSQPSTRPQSVTLCEEAGGTPSASACTLTFVDSGLAFDIPDLISHRTEQNIQVRAVRRSNETEACVPAFENVDRDVEFWSTYVDPGASGRPVSRAMSIDGTDISGDAAAPTTQTLSFGAGGIAEISVRYPDAGQLSLGAEYNGSPGTGDDGLVMPGSDLFSSRPAGLCVSTAGVCAAADSSCSAFVRAGESFDLSMTAVGWQSDTDSDFCVGNPVTPNFEMQNIGLTHGLIAPTAGQAGDFIFKDPATGDVSYSGITYDHVASSNAETIVPTVAVTEVGVFDFTADPPVNGYFGQTIPASSSQPSGRFYPDSFDVTTTDNGGFSAACTSGATFFSYFGEEFGWDVPPSFEFSALSTKFDPDRPAQVTQNYTIGGFMKLTASDVVRSAPVADAAVSDANGDPLTVNAVTNTGLLNALGATGTMEFIYSSLDIIGYQKDAAARVQPLLPTLEFLVTGIVDSDGVTATGMPLTLTPDAPHEIRYGRMELSNAYGPETADLSMPFEAQYWLSANDGYVRNGDDNCYGYDTSTDVALSDGAPALPVGLTSVDGRVDTLAGGTSPAGSDIVLTAPGEGNQGNVVVELSVPLKLQDDFDGDGTIGVAEYPTSLATFGVYRGNDRVIYWEER